MATAWTNPRRSTTIEIRHNVDIHSVANTQDEGHEMESKPAKNQSTFVTVLAWVFIVLFGFGTFMSIAQNVMLSFMPVMQVPDDAGFMLKNFRLFFLLPLIVSALFLASSIGLLKRREWARKTIIGLLSLGVLYSAGSLLFIWFFGFGAPLSPPPGASAAAQQSMQEMNSFFLGMKITVTLFALAFSAVMIWIVKKLVQPETCEEFST